jgi:protein-disulfide isomerase
MKQIESVPGLLLALTLASVAGCSASSIKSPAGAAPVPDGAEHPAAQRVLPEDFRNLGDPGAPVTIIEFTDLQCPYCARFSLHTFPELQERYIDTGQVRYAARDLPLPMHDFAVPAAVAAVCAGEQGQYWEYRHALFRRQADLGWAPYDELAERAGLDLDAFSRCRADPRSQASVRQDAALARSFGIQSTPTFVIGRLVNGEFQGEIVSGALTIDAISARIEPLLKAARPD